MKLDYFNLFLTSVEEVIQITCARSENVSLVHILCVLNNRIFIALKEILKNREIYIF